MSLAGDTLTEAGFEWSEPLEAYIGPPEPSDTGDPVRSVIRMIGVAVDPAATLSDPESGWFRWVSAALMGATVPTDIQRYGGCWRPETWEKADSTA